MRVKDENKKQAIINAVVKLSNDVGFSNLSMSKIAKATGLSAATLYVYFENKEDMFRRVYVEVKSRMAYECSKGISEDGDIEMSIRRLCENLLAYMQSHTGEFLFIEQSCNSPLATEEMIEEINQINAGTTRMFQRGIQEGILKDTSPALLIGFCYYPIQQIFKEWRKEKSMLPEINFEEVFQMCWDAVRR